MLSIETNLSLKSKLLSDEIKFVIATKTRQAQGYYVTPNLILVTVPVPEMEYGP